MYYVGEGGASWRRGQVDELALIQHWSLDGSLNVSHLRHQSRARLVCSFDCNETIADDFIEVNMFFRLVIIMTSQSISNN